jgi:ribonuclease/clavin/mitogillin
VRRPEEIGDRPFAAGAGELEPIPTPGHAPDHLCFFDRQSGDLFCGDLLRADGTIVIPASKGGHMGQYLASLREIRDLEPRRLLPGHGPIVIEPLALIEKYLLHRERREAQVVAALAAGARTPAEIAARIYGRLPASLADAAEDSVLAHLIKLKEEGR